MPENAVWCRCLYCLDQGKENVQNLNTIKHTGAVTFTSVPTKDFNSFSTSQSSALSAAKKSQTKLSVASCITAHTAVEVIISKSSAIV